MHKNTKTFLWAFVIVLGGIWIVSKLVGMKAKPSNVLTDSAGNPLFYGPAIDPLTGDSNIPQAKTGTVAFTAQLGP